MRVTDQAIRVVPAGWYEDPASSSHVRWWNGVAWTEHVMDKPDAARQLERQYGIDTAESAAITANAHRDLELEASASTAATEPATTRRAAMAAETAGTAAARTSTGSVWLIALSPIVALLVALLAGYVYFYVAANPFIVLAAVVPYLLALLWAVSDRRALLARGLQPASALWGLLGPLIYLIARRVRVAGSGPLVMFVVVAALVIGVPAVAVATGSAAPVTKALDIQHRVSADMIAAGQATSVSCPAIIDSTAAGTLFTCDATLASGATEPVWVSIDSNDGAFSYAPSLNAG